MKYYAYDYNLCSSNILFKSCKIDEDIKTLGVVEVKHQAYTIYDNKIIYDGCSTGFQTLILNPRLLVEVQRRRAKLLLKSHLLCRRALHRATTVPLNLWNCDKYILQCCLTIWCC